ncbi:hypothetical protein B0H19DRAFT_1263844 [Mycena capillaripes]|nr:hypothetical protein B0H19DRAFT_1263844 [Mycena capillaripes]
MFPDSTTPSLYGLTMRYTLFLLASSNLQLALASLYPTHPTAETIFRPGERANLTWIDTHPRPHLAEMGSLAIHLCTTNGTSVFTFAKEVSPMSRVHSVEIPQNLALHGSSCNEFVIIFMSVYPIMRIWTHDFCITPSITDSTASYIPQVDEANTTNPLITFVLPTTTIVSELAPTTKVPAATTISAEAPQGDEAGTGLNRVHSPNSANPRQGSEYQDVRFPLVFIAWPALIGISLAL